jgi:hypothetical protein
MGLQLGSSLGRLYKQGVGAARANRCHLAVAAAAHPMPAPAAPRGRSSPEAQHFLPVRVDTSEVLHLEHKDEPHEGDERTDDLATARHCYDAYDYIESLPLHLRV